jgi:hypothetical protein
MATAMLLLPSIVNANTIKSIACIDNTCAIEATQAIKYKISTQKDKNSKIIILDILNTDSKSGKVPNSLTMSGKEIYLAKTALHSSEHFFRIAFIANPDVKYSVSQSGNYLSILFNSQAQEQASTQPQQAMPAVNSTPPPSSALVKPLADSNGNVETIEYTPNQIINVGLMNERTTEIDLPAHISKLITGISTDKISAEVLDNKLFLKPLADNIGGDLYINCTNGNIYHFFLQSASQAPLTLIVNDIQKKNINTSSAMQEESDSISNFLIEVRNHSDDLDVAVIKNPTVSYLTKDITLTLIKSYQGQIYTAYEGIIKNISPVRIRVPYEKIYFKNLLGIAVDDMYLNPSQESKIWFITSYKGRLE